MSLETNDKDQQKNSEKPAVKPDPETLHKTDPQKNMEGPISSLMHNAGESFDTNETKEEADEEKEKDM